MAKMDEDSKAQLQLESDYCSCRESLNGTILFIENRRIEHLIFQAEVLTSKYGYRLSGGIQLIRAAGFGTIDVYAVTLLLDQ